MNVERGLWPEGLVAGLATLSVAWPITSLLRDNNWVADAILMIAVVAAVGALLRSAGTRPALVVVGQTLAALVGLCWRYFTTTLWYGLPTTDTVAAAAALLRDAGTVLQQYAAPAPTTEGVAFLIVSVLTLTAVSVDAIGVTGRAPATAGIPLAAAFLVSVSNTGRAMPPQYFVAAAAAWLAMIAQQGDRLVAGWSSADRRESVGSHDVAHGPTGHRKVARALGAVTVLGALVVGSLLPHLPPTFFADGLARDAEANDLSDGGQVSFTETMDLTQDLNSRSDAPTIRYRTLDRTPQPLRVTSTKEFDGTQWLAPTYEPQPQGPAGALFEAPALEELGPDVPVREGQVRVLTNALDPPHVAVPPNLLTAQFDAPAEWDEGTGSVRLTDRSGWYDVTFLHVAPGGNVPDSVGEQAADPRDFDPELLTVDPTGQEAISALADDVVGDATNDLEVASRIQNHLRSGLYSYSLTLAPGGDGTEPISHFLQTRTGYCVQFATAMVMMARHEGIPARMAVGFLPGELQPDSVRVVRAADAHTWPELWIEGMGWTRFEPTPGIRTGQAPAYSQDEAELNQTDPTAGANLPPPVQTEPPAANAQSGLWQSVQSLAPELGRVLLVLVVLALLMALMPWAGRRYREASLRRARTPRERIEGQWELLTRSLEDLGVGPPDQRTPRQMRRYYADSTHLDRRSEEALGRVTATLERARYAPGSEADAHAEVRMGRDVRAVVDFVLEQLPWNMRANARLLPRSGLQYLRERLTGWRR